MSFDKIYAYIKNLKIKHDLKNVSPFRISKIVINDVLIDNITTKELNIQTCKICLNLSYKNDYDYYRLAGYIYCDNMHKDMCLDTTELYSTLHKRNPHLLSQEFVDFFHSHTKFYKDVIDLNRDYLYDYFALITLENGYLIGDNSKEFREVPQQMLLRTATQIHFTRDIDEKKKLEEIKNTYDLLSQHRYTHATPTLFNSGFKRNQLSSCFLLGNLEDSIDTIYGKTLTDSALISKNSGGIGIALHSIRAKNSFIRGTNGRSNGIIPMLKVFDSTAKYVDQGGGKRNGSIAFFLEPWHADVIDFLNAKRPSGDESKKARDLFYALWIPDLFMKRLAQNGIWSLFCPNKCPGLDKIYGDEFEKLYSDYENRQLFESQIKASELFYMICDTLIETGTPYILFKDNVNRYSNQKNLGTIRSSNLCCEIMQYSDKNETAVCNLASINLSSFCKDEKKYDFKNLWNVVYDVTKNLNYMIDTTYYPTESCKRSNLRHRPIAIGVQGLANVFFSMRVRTDSQEARFLNDDIFETIYHASLSASVDLAKTDGPYETFEGSPFSQGLFQFDMMGKKVGEIQGFENQKPNIGKWDWETLRENMVKYGTRNSQLTAVMPTASTSQILGNYEGIEFPQTNIFVRTTKAGKFPVINKFLINDLKSRNLWTDEIRSQILNSKGSIHEINEIPEEIKKMYPTIWNIPQKILIDMSIDRQKYIDQSQSLNIYYDPSQGNIYERLLSVFTYSWKNKLKTGIYYLRTKPATHAINFTDADQSFQKHEEPDIECTACSA